MHDKSTLDFIRLISLSKDLDIEEKMALIFYLVNPIKITSETLNTHLLMSNTRSLRILGGLFRKGLLGRERLSGIITSHLKKDNLIRFLSRDDVKE